MCLWYQILSETKLETVHWVQQSYLSLSSVAEWVRNSCGRSMAACIFVRDRRKVNEYCCWCQLLFWASGTMEGDHLVLVSPLVMGKWIVRERSVEPHLSLDSSISLFIFPPHAQGGLPNSCNYVCVCVCVSVWSRDALHVGNACSLNFHICSTVYTYVGAVVVIAFLMRFRLKN